MCAITPSPLKFSICSFSLSLLVCELLAIRSVESFLMEEVSRSGLPIGYGLNEVCIEVFELVMILCRWMNSDVGWIL